MPRIAIVGGKLQGTEAAYLSREAGFETLLIDKDSSAPAQKLCTEFICADVLSDEKIVTEALESADMILPAMENAYVLENLTRLSEKRKYKIAFDWEAYKISSSKLVSDKIFADNGVSCPKYYPQGKLPYIAKPSGESGSHGVELLDTEEKLNAFLKKSKSSEYVIQEFAEGMSYSIEIIGRPGNYRTYEITEIFVDDDYDCNIASCYRMISPEHKRTMEKMAVKIAEIIGLKGIMDLEVIDRGGEILALEIDARLPSQTPSAVYHATGMNYIKELYDLFCRGDFADPQADKGEYASYMQYFVTENEIACRGERIMTEGNLLEYTSGICSEAQVISDYNSKSKNEWRGIFISSDKSPEGLKAKEKLTLQELENIIRR